MFQRLENVNMATVYLNHRFVHGWRATIHAAMESTKLMVGPVWMLGFDSILLFFIGLTR